MKPSVGHRSGFDASRRPNPYSDPIDDYLAVLMFDNIKRGLLGEILVNRGFDDDVPPPAAPYWERYRHT